MSSIEEDPMEPYPQPAPGTDDFAASRANLDKMIAHLSGADMMICSQQALEEYVTSAGRELQRQLMQVTRSLRDASQA